MKKNVDELYDKYTQFNTTIIEEIYDQFDLIFEKSQEEIEKVSTEIFKQMKNSFNDLLMKIESSNVQINFQQNIEYKTIARSVRY